MEGGKQGSEEPSCPAEPAHFQLLLPKSLRWLIILLIQASISWNFKAAPSEFFKVMFVGIEGSFCFKAATIGLPGLGWVKSTSSPDAPAWMIPENARPITVIANAARQREVLDARGFNRLPFKIRTVCCA